MLGWATPAAAHADFTSSTPADGSIVDEAPSEISLRFTEGIDLQSDGIRLLDADGTPVALGPATADGATATVPIEAELERGSYVVAWRAVSADGHPIRGAFTFSVGQRSAVSGGIAEGAFGSTDDRTLEVTGAVARFVAYLGTLGACGAVLVGTRLRRNDEPTPVGRAVAMGLGAALVALGVQLVTLGALVTGEGLGSIAQPGVLALVFDEGFGITAVIAAISLLGVTITAGLPFEGAARSIALVGATVAPISMVLYGHTRTMSPAWLGYTADAIHLLAGTVWFGGLLATIAVVRLRRRHDETGGAAEAIATFSGIAAIAASLVIAAGVVMSWIEVGSIEALTSTTYGQLLLAKISTIVVVLACAAWNRYHLLPHVTDGTADDRRQPDAASTAQPSDDRRGGAHRRSPRPHQRAGERHPGEGHQRSPTHCRRGPPRRWHRRGHRGTRPSRTQRLGGGVPHQRRGDRRPVPRDRRPARASRTGDRTDRRRGCKDRAVAASRSTTPT